MWSHSQNVHHFDKMSPLMQHEKNSNLVASNHPTFNLHNADQHNANEDAKKLYQKALDINFLQKIHNKDLYGEHNPDSAILVVQVHDRAEYFQELVKSLKRVEDIDKATLVISCDKFSESIENVINRIDFCRFMVIFFPFSMQLFPDSFPGEDPNDCPRDIPKAEAIAKKCNNADYPDKYGHYREVKYVQTKHHWMWKLHMVFSGIKAFADTKAPVILLEEDYYVLSDLIHCAKKAMDLRDARCQKCGFISLGNYETTSTLAKNNENYNQVEIRSWVSSKSNMGLVLSQSTYKLLSDCSDAICEFDDYNWDWSLQAAFKEKEPEKLFTMQFKTTRIYHLGSCGGMHAKKHCDLKTEVEHIEKQITGLSMFPESLHVALDNPAVSSMPKQNGGWGDLRDHSLCKSFKTMYPETSR